MRAKEVTGSGNVMLASAPAVSLFTGVVMLGREGFAVVPVPIRLAEITLEYLELLVSETVSRKSFSAPSMSLIVNRRSLTGSLKVNVVTD